MTSGEPDPAVDDAAVADEGFRMSGIMMQQGEFSLAGRSQPGKSRKMTSSAFAPGGNPAFKAGATMRRREMKEFLETVIVLGTKTCPADHRDQAVVLDTKRKHGLEERAR